MKHWRAPIESHIKWSRPISARHVHNTRAVGTLFREALVGLPNVGELFLICRGACAHQSGQPQNDAENYVSISIAQIRVESPAEDQGGPQTKQTSFAAPYSTSYVCFNFNRYENFIFRKIWRLARTSHVAEGRCRLWTMRSTKQGGQAGHGRNNRLRMCMAPRSFLRVPKRA